MGSGSVCRSPRAFCWDVTAPSSALRPLQEETEQPAVSYSSWQAPANPFGRVSPVSSPQAPQGLSGYFPNTSTHSAAEPNPPRLGQQSEVVRTTQAATQGTGVTLHLQFHDLMLRFPGSPCFFRAELFTVSPVSLSCTASGLSVLAHYFELVLSTDLFPRRCSWERAEKA